MCTKQSYDTRWSARAALVALQRKGKPVRGVHPCFFGHAGAWHVTSQRTAW